MREKGEDSVDRRLKSGSSGHSRRGFIQKTALATFGALLGTPVVFGRFLPKGIIPIGLDFLGDPLVISGKHKELLILNDRPINAETPPHLLDDLVTPADKLFVRNNGNPPHSIDEEIWTLTVDGESVKTPKTYTLAELKSRFEEVTYQLTIECGGNGRSEFNPPAKGNQWGNGAVGCPSWTGVKLKDVLNDVGIKENAVYVGYYGVDTHLSGDTSKVVISRGVPIKKAMENESIIAWKMNGENIPNLHGFPLRVVFGGWPASTSGKWLTRLSVRNKEHDGPKMGGQSYRVPCKPVAPGSEVPDNEMCIVESMPVKSLITYPKTGGILKSRRSLEVRGHAWAGDVEVAVMHVSIDFGQTWQKAALEKPVNRLAWQHWSTTVNFPESGYYEVWAKATDATGKAQPMVVPDWNPKGYLNNACHRIAIKVL
ncbi:MAG: sulfite oxidase [Flavobacteriales bacterium]|nr:sulfite oxidase [Flavobacteriales bacterium]